MRAGAVATLRAYYGASVATVVGLLLPSIHAIVGGVDRGQVYENFRWAEPPLTWLDQPLHLEAGDRLRLRCEWKNESDVTLHYGDSAKDEMCNLNGYFFRDAEIPAEARTGIAGVLLPVVE